MSAFDLSARGLLLAGSLFAFAAVPALAEPPAPPMISVSAEGSAAMAPDMAVTTLTVLNEAETARAALDANNATMDKLMAALKAESIAERDLQTAGFSIQPRWLYPEPKDGQQVPPSIIGYQVQNTLSVRIRDLDRLGAILDASVTLGVNQGGDVRFTNDNPDTAIEEARRDAVSRAMAKAQQLADAAGVKLGRITQISEQSSSQPPMPMMEAQFAKSAMRSDSSVPMAAGENEYRVSVSINFEIAP
ncbi:hypothetical protein DFR52_106213 [Hoeflea marina]|uniref:SIMPL domain-containing protein n=1 Tax=Hoeflea marina TaxID=274592 RepID=A0A317PDT0_9HYPH|nr:SIMPL domain-containing protein [Hoeflea marina]PWV97689.1 hypothetical protein DFR52_106213 [Hoeflea marina]